MSALVLLSGGMDSALALHWALARHDRVAALSIDYGQRHSVELVAARKIATHATQIADNFTGLTEIKIEIPWQSSSLTGGGDSPVIPGRNSILVALAAAEAQAHGLDVVVIACVLDDAGTFPDCRQFFLATLHKATQLATGVGVDAPFAGMTKRQCLAEASAAAMEAAMLSWSCYAPQWAGARAPIPCRECGACLARERAFA